MTEERLKEIEAAQELHWADAAELLLEVRRLHVRNDAELHKIEGEHAVAADDYQAGYTRSLWSFMRDRAPSLIASVRSARTELDVERGEVARLRATIKSAERGETETIADSDGYGETYLNCPWCKSEGKHKADCMAFTPDGRVK